MRKTQQLMRLILLLCCTLTPAAAQEGTTPPSHWYDDVTIHGLASTGFTWNANRPVDRINRFRVFDTRHNTFGIDVFELALAHPAAAPGTGGFRVDLTAGSAIPPLTRASGMIAGDVDVQQLFVSWVAPIGNGLQIDVGKFVTPVGYELIEGYDGWNDSYSRSLLFGYAIPFTHTGLRATYAFSTRVSLLAMVVNGWDNVVDNNTAKSVGAQLLLAPHENLSLTAGVISGPERENNDADARSVIDVCMQYRPFTTLSIGANFDIGSERAAAANADATWSGAAVYLRYTIHEALALSLRAETFRDADGVRTGQAQTLNEITLTPEYRVDASMLLRVDLRVDHSNLESFMRKDGSADTQASIAFNMLYAF
jgi:hypothetical protein